MVLELRVKRAADCSAITPCILGMSQESPPQLADLHAPLKLLCHPTLHVGLLMNRADASLFNSAALIIHSS